MRYINLRSTYFTYLLIRVSSVAELILLTDKLMWIEGIFGQSSGSSTFGTVKTQATISGAFSGGAGSVQSAGFGGFQKQPTSPPGIHNNKNNNNNDNNNKHDSVYGAVIMLATLRVHPVHMINMERHQAAAYPQPRPNDTVCEFARRLPEATPTIVIN